MARMTKVHGTRSVYLLPTLTGSGSDVFKRGGMEYAIASLPEVKKHIRGIGQDALSRAHGYLGVIRALAKMEGIDGDNWVQLDLKMGRTDGTLILTDTKGGHKGAMSIEYGRDEYITEDKNGNIRVIAGMAGKFILHRAFRLPPSGSVLNGTGGGDIK